MISARSSTCGAEAEPAAEDDAEAEAEAGEFMAEIIAASFRTEAQKLALCEKCLQPPSPLTLLVAASMYMTNAEAKAGMQKQRQRKPELTRTRHEISHKIKGATLAMFLMRVSRGST